MKFDEIKTPCFVLESEKLVSNIRSFKKALDRQFKKNILGYSVKTNSTPVLLDILRNEGCFAEVVSYDDLIREGSLNAAKEKGLVRSEGKEYIMKDGDIVLFKFNV